MKKIKFTKFMIAAVLALTGVVGVSGLVSTGVASAEEGKTGTTMTVSPPNQDIILTPGETYSGSIKVSNSNSSTQPLKYSLSVGSFYQKASENSPDDYGDTDLTSVGNYNQIMQWIKFDQPTGEVAPNETVTVPFTINVPQDAPAGGQYATILVKNVSDRPESSSNIQIQSESQIASILYAEVAGTTRQEADIMSNNFPAFLLSNPLTASSMVKNNGNVHTEATYTLQVWPMFSDEEICTNEEKPTKETILPDTKRYHTETCQLGVVGAYRVKQTVSIFGEVSSIERTVIICPIWLILIIIAIIFMIIFYFVKRARDRKRNR